MGVFQVPDYDVWEEFDPDFFDEIDIFDDPDYWMSEPNMNQQVPIKVTDPAEIKAKLLAMAAAKDEYDKARQVYEKALQESKQILKAYTGYAIVLDEDTILQVGGGGQFTKLKVVKP